MAHLVTKKTPLLLFLVFSVVAGGAGLGSSFYTKRYLQSERVPDTDTGVALTPLSSLPTEELLNDNQKIFDWIQKKDYTVRVEAWSRKSRSYVQTEGLLKMAQDGSAFTVTGIGRGKVVFQKNNFEDVVAEAAFHVDFRTERTATYLSESGYVLDEDGLITEQELQTVRKITIKDGLELDFSDFDLFPKLESLQLEAKKLYAAENASNIASKASIYVGRNLYSDYMADASWNDVDKQIFITHTTDDVVSVILNREGGNFKEPAENTKDYFPIEVKKGSTYEDLEKDHPIFYEGHTYKGWSYNDRSSFYSKTMVFDKDVKLYADFEAQKYTVHFHYRDGAQAKEEAVEGFLYNDGIALPKTADLAYSENYVFRGWSGNPNQKDIDYSPDETIFHLFETDTFDYHLYGIWAHRIFRVRYMNGEKEISSSSYAYGSTVTISVPTKKIPGQGRFVGFSRDKNATTPEYRVGDVEPNFYARDIESSDILLYAVFDKTQSYTLTYFDKDGASLKVDSTKYYDYNPVPLMGWDEYAEQLTREGSRFVGWKDRASKVIYVDSHIEYERLVEQGVGNLVDAETNQGFATDNFHDVDTVLLDPYFVTNTYNIVFSTAELGAGDSMYEDAVATFGKALPLTGTISRYGYNFQYFTSPDVDGNIEVNNGAFSLDTVNAIYRALRDGKFEGKDNEFEPTGSTVLTATWLGVDCTAHFIVTRGESSYDDQALHYGDLIVKPSDPTATGFVFEGWYTDEDVLWDFASPIEGDMNLTTKWSKDGEYVVVYVMNGVGVAPEDTHEYLYGDKVHNGVAPEPEHVPGYNFAGWYADEGLTEAFDFANYTINSLRTSVYAKWEAISYTVNFDNKGHGAEYPSQVLPYGAAVQDPGPMEESKWVFRGWYLSESYKEGELWDFRTSRIEESLFPTLEDHKLTLYAKWEELSYKVTFTSSVDPTFKEVFTVRAGEKIVNPPEVPDVVGYTQGQWVVEDALGEPYAYDPDAPVMAPMNVVARYEIVKYTVSYVTPVGVLPNNEIVSYGNNVTNPNTQDTESWHFVGWFTEQTFENQWNFDLDRPTKAITLYAKWVAYIDFNANDDKSPKDHNVANMPSRQEVVYGEKATRPGDPAGTGLSFVGWTTAPNGSTAFNFNSPVQGHTTVYARWNKLQYTLSFDSNGGTSCSSQNRLYGQTGSLPSPTRSGYNFVGWFDGGTQWSSSTPMASKNVKLVAHWEDTCVAWGTLVTMADGAQKPVEEVQVGDLVLSYNHYTGEQEAVPVLLNEIQYDAYSDIIDLLFSDGRSLRIVNEHGLFDATLNHYITVGQYNYEELIGHRFFLEDLTEVTLVQATCEKGFSNTGSLFTAGSMNHYYNGILSTFVLMESILNVFELDENHNVDLAKMEEDIATYGLLSLEDFDGMLPEEFYEMLNAKYLSVSIGKGLTTFEGLTNLIHEFLHYESGGEL